MPKITVLAARLAATLAVALLATAPAHARKARHPAPKAAAKPAPAPAAPPPATEAPSAAMADEPPPPPPVTAETYPAALARVRTGDLAVDFKSLRRQHAAAAGYLLAPWAEAKANFDKLDADPAAALVGAEAALTQDYLNLEAHLLAEIALGRLGRKDEAAGHHALLLAFVRSVTEGHDGRTAETAWNAAAVPEEYFALMLMGYKPDGQALVNNATGTFDRMQVTDRKSGEKGEIWFDVSSFFGKEFEAGR